MLASEAVPVDESLAGAGGQLRQEDRASHGVGLGESLIAASAAYRETELVTFNRRHYPMVEDLTVPYRR